MLHSGSLPGGRVAPAVPSSGVLVAPLGGDMEGARIADIAASLLAQVELSAARHVVLDMTGVPVDARVAQAVLDVAQALRLFGARALLAGMRADASPSLPELWGLKAYPDIGAALGSIE